MGWRGLLEGIARWGLCWTELPDGETGGNDWRGLPEKVTRGGYGNVKKSVCQKGLPEGVCQSGLPEGFPEGVAGGGDQRG